MGESRVLINRRAISRPLSAWLSSKAVFSRFVIENTFRIKLKVELTAMTWGRVLPIVDSSSLVETFKMFLVCITLSIAQSRAMSSGEVALSELTCDRPVALSASRACCRAWCCSSSDCSQTLSASFADLSTNLRRLIRSKNNATLDSDRWVSHR